MISGAASGFSQFQAINQLSGQIGQANRQGNQQTVSHLEVVSGQKSQAVQKVLSNAIDVKHVANEVKGNIINVMA